jgi:hypothetical protein
VDAAGDDAPGAAGAEVAAGAGRHRGARGPARRGEKSGPDGVAVAHKLYHGVAINGPDYDQLGSHFGFGGEKVEDPARLRPALEQALAEVGDGRTAIVNVVLSR